MVKLSKFYKLQIIAQIYDNTLNTDDSKHEHKMHDPQIA